MYFFHILCKNSHDYEMRRETPYPHHLPNAHLGDTYRQVHVGMHSARIDTLIAAGPSSDGSYAHMFYRANNQAELDTYLQNDPYQQIGIWQQIEVCALTFLIHKTSLPSFAQCIDQPRRVIASVGQIRSRADIDTAALIAARDRGRLIVGGITEGGKFYGWINTTDFQVADSLLETCGISPTKNKAQEVIWVL